MTALEFELHPVGPEVATVFSWYPGDAIVDGFRQFRDLVASVPPEVSTLVFLAFVPALDDYPEDHWGEPALIVLGAHAGAPETGEAELEPFRNLDDAIVDFGGRMAYGDLQTMLDEDYPTGRNYYWKSVYLDELTDEVIDVVDATGRAAPSDLTTVDVWHLGGAISDVPRDETAFWHRDARYLLNYEANWDDPGETDANVEWVRESIETVSRLPGVGGGYSNFPGGNEDPARAVFGDNHDRLAEVKAQYDPTNLFRLNKNVEPRS